MTDLRDAAERMIAAMFPCRCDKTWTGRGRHEPGCLATDAKDSAEELVNGLVALAESDIARHEAELAALRARLSPQQKADSSDIVCPLCGEGDHDALGLRLHFINELCDYFQRVIESENNQ